MQNYKIIPTYANIISLNASFSIGIKFKPCNIDTAEAHNRRDRAYCEAVARKFGHTYFLDEYHHLNQSWRNPSYSKPLPELLEDMKVLVKHFEPFVRWLEGYGISVIRIDLHHDEGHADPETDDLRQNHQAHIIVDWLNHETGKTVTIDSNVCKEMQTVLAESLGMERGTLKEDTGIQGLSAVEY